jgi:hypothetical protein
MAVLVLGTGRAYAGQNANGSITVTPSVAAAGSVVHIKGSASPKGCSVDDAAIPTDTAALFPPDGFGPPAARNSQGAFDLTYTVPTSTPAGSYQIGLRCGGGNVGVFTTLRVTAAPAGAPATGAGGTAHGSPVLWTLLGVCCLVFAAALALVRRRLAGRVFGPGR